MFTRLLTVAQLTAGLLLLGADALVAQGNGLCLGPDTNSTALVNFARKLIKGTNIHVDSLRDRVGLGGIDTSSVIVVTNAETCFHASVTLNHILHPPGALGRQVYVVQAGAQRYIVQDPNDKAGEWAGVWVLDAQFKLVSPLMK